MLDRFHRKIDYMRISVTDRCNLRCRYCMPFGIDLIPMEDILRYEEILMVCRQAADLGIVKFKITGGEPLVRKGCVDLIREIKNIPGVEQVTLTTNGVLLKDYLPGLKEAGIDGINISLDTLNPEKFREISGFSRFPDVMEGIRQAADMGFRVKINCVLQKGMNEEEWKDLAELARVLPIDVRFIELMPIGEGSNEEVVSNELLFEKFCECYQEIEKDDSVHGNGPAVYYKIPGFKGSIGFISAIHGKFCGFCNRIRMTSTGQIKPCLCYDDSYSVKEAVRSGDREAVRKILAEAVERKPQMHCFESKDKVTEKKKMVQIGG